MTTSLHRRQVLGASAALLTGPILSGAATAQDKYPSKPLRVIVGLPAGGVADTSIRLLTAAMQPALGQTIVVENKPGASFALAMQALAQAPADGYTLLHMVSPVLSSQAVQKRFDVFKSLQPIAMMGSTDLAYVVGAKSAHKSVQDVIAWARANPGKLTYASSGIGSLEHLSLVALCKRHGMEAVHVPFKGGPEIVQAVATGETDLSILAVPLVVQFAPKNMLRALVVLNTKRNAAIPDVPDLSEARLDVPPLTAWGGLAAPAGTPKAVVDQLEKLVIAAVDSPELRKQYQAIGLQPESSSAAAFAKLWKDDWVWISKAASDARLDAN